MKYHIGLLNEYGVFQRLNSLLSDSGYGEPFSNRIEHFLYRASCVLSSLRNMYAAEENTVVLVRSYIKQIEFGADKKISVSAEPLFYVYAQIPTYLTLLVAMQNDILIILQKLLNISGEVPSSLNKAMKKDVVRYGFSSEIQQALKVYWESGGKYLRDVRDINEHHLALVDYSYFKYENDPGQVVIYLPDNPEAKSPKRFTYLKEIDAYETIAQGFNNINSLMDSILMGIGIEPTPFTPSLSMGQMGDLVKPQNRTLGLMINIQSREVSEEGAKLVLDTIEIKQIIPETEGGGNISLRKMKVDNEIEN
jgi:hypothetical protein